MASFQYDDETKRSSPSEGTHSSGATTPDRHRPKILDIRRDKLAISLEDEVRKGLVGKAEGEKSLPTLLLYSAEGLKLFEEITYLEEYYLTNTEIAILEQQADAIAERVEDGSVVLELGSGNLRKVNIFLQALDRQGKKIDYYALDLDLSELQRTLDLVPTDSLHNVNYNGLHGTYEDGQVWLKNSPQMKGRPRCVLWLGSSAANFDAGGAAKFLKSFAEDALRVGENDCMLVGLDGCKDADRVWTAYNDPKGVTERFIMSGLPAANDVLGGKYFNTEDWEYIGEWNAEHGRHQAYYSPKKDIKFSGRLEGVEVKKGERVHVEYSYKFDDEDSRKLWEEAGLVEAAQWANEKGDYYLYMLQKPAFVFPSTAAEYAPEPTPTIAEWRELWKSWDTVTLGMIPREELLSKPIHLRNPCIFYLGHTPTFLDSLLMRSTSLPATEPENNYQQIFQRGIDPDVDNPDHCHKHSDIPESWPELNKILSYQRKVRARTEALYNKGSASHQSPEIKRALWLGFEHEAMHLETLLYMLLQSPTTLPPPGAVRPDFVSGHTWSRRKDAAPGQEWITIPETKLTIGIADPESSESTTPHFGWDNEKPPRSSTVPSFISRTHPITNGEYASYLAATSGTIPASWCTNLATGAPEVRTVFGSVPLEHAQDWPVMASYDELRGCAVWMGARIPSADEVNAIYRFAEEMEPKLEKKIGGLIDAVNGHLIHNGVCESPPTDLFADLQGKSFGFKTWHPTSVRASGGKLLGRAETGGAWEWTSSVLERHEGFVEEGMYPEYTADFFDGKHNIVLGASWATHPRIAGRKSFVNWYQRNYRFMWATARPVKDI